jgi:hypothetical protein
MAGVARMRRSALGSRCLRAARPPDSPVVSCAGTAVAQSVAVRRTIVRAPSGALSVGHAGGRARQQESAGGDDRREEPARDMCRCVRHGRSGARERGSGCVRVGVRRESARLVGRLARTARCGRMSCLARGLAAEPGRVSTGSPAEPGMSCRACGSSAEPGTSCLARACTAEPRLRSTQYGGGGSAPVKRSRSH